MVKRNIPRKAQTLQKKWEKHRKEELQKNTIKKAELYVWKWNVTFCNNCRKPKMPDVMRTWIKERWFCECWKWTLYEEIYCYEIVQRFKEKKDKLLNEIKFYKISEKKEDDDKEIDGSMITEEWYQHWWVRSTSPKQILAYFPTFEERSTEKNILERTRAHRCEIFPPFSHACDMCRQIQYYILIKWWLNNTFNSNIVKLLWQNYFWLSETNKIIPIDQNVTEEDMDRIEKLLSRKQQRRNADKDETV